MLDVSGSMEGNLPLLRGASQQLFRRLLAEDRARIGTFGQDVTISPTFTRDDQELLRELPDRINPDAPTPLWRAVDQAMDGFDTEGDERHVILVLSDGKDSGPISFRQKNVSQAEVIDRARAEDVMVYGIGMRSRPLRSPNFPVGPGPGGLQAMLTADLPDPGLARVAEETGGGYSEIRFGQDLGAAFAQVADELHSQYLLGYALPRKDGKVHDIDVRVSQRGLKPRAKKTYLAPR
jgi:VWFA-related protein